MPSIDISTKWDYPAFPVTLVTAEKPHGVIGMGSVVAAPFNLAPATTTPTIGNFTPNPAAQIAATTAIGFDVTDPHGFRKIVVYAIAADGGEEVVWDGTAFSINYATASTRTVITNGFRFSVLRNGGWVVAPRVTVIAVNTDGFEASTAPPVISNWTPTIGTRITPTTPIGFDVTDAKGFSSIIVYGTGNGGAQEIAWNGSAFTTHYTASTRAVITNGYRFRIVRDTGWLAMPQVTVAAVNLDGIEA